MEETFRKFDSNTRLTLLTCPENAEEYLHLNKNQLNAMTSVDCGIGAHVLSQYAAYIQRIHNNAKQIVNWLEANVNLLIADSVKRSPAYSYAEKRVLAISECAPEFQREINKWRVQMDRLDYLATRVEYMGRTLSELQTSKRGLERHLQKEY